MDVVWLRGSNQGDKAGTYLATRQWVFATEEMENFMIESGIGPECGNSPWAAMLTETHQVTHVDLVLPKGERFTVM